MKARFEPSGDAAVVVIVAEAPSVEATTRIAVVEHDLSNAVDLDVVPALTSLLVTFDPLHAGTRVGAADRLWRVARARPRRGC